MVTDCIDITTLNLGELSGVVSLYPWYAGARMELCRRMASLGEEAWDSSKYSDHALYIPSRRLVFAQMEKSRKAQAAAFSGDGRRKIYRRGRSGKLSSPG